MSDVSSAATQFNAVLNRCRENDRDHARLVCLFAQLESMGAQKIHRHLRWNDSCINTEILSHAAEEARHALFFARQLKKIPGLNNGTTSVKLARRYIRSLDLCVGRHVKQCQLKDRRDMSRLSYLLMTSVIERRASQVYTAYECQIAAELPKFTLKSILREEARHLSQINARLTEISATCPQIQQVIKELICEEVKFFARLSADL